MKWVATAFGVVALLAVVLICIALLRWQRTFDAPLPEIHASSDPKVIAQGRYIAYGPGHCVGCHTDRTQRQAVAAGEQPPLTGGLEFKLPFGTIRTPYMRWSQAWMLLALATLVDSQAVAHTWPSESPAAA